MNKDDTKQAIIGFTEFMKGITGNKDLKIPEDIAKEYGIERDDASDNLESEGCCISRQAMNDAIDIAKMCERSTKSLEDYIIKSCEDCISRQAMIDAFWKLDIELRPNAIDAILKMINDLPPVTPNKPQESEVSKMTKEQKDKILKALAEDRNNYARDCERRIAVENGKVAGAEYMLQRILDVLHTEVEPHEESEEK